MQSELICGFAETYLANMYSDLTPKGHDKLSSETPTWPSQWSIGILPDPSLLRL